jgi:hypothetical protein
MKIELEISEDHEGTESPYWLILDPHQMLALNVNDLASMITGPFFSRKEAQDHLEARSYNFSEHAKVYCHSGYWSHQYKEACRKGLKS